MTRTLNTLNSIYEIDEDGKRIRRVSGKNDPTGHFQPDGEWKPYVKILPWMHGARMVLWPDGQATILSVVVSET